MLRSQLQMMVILRMISILDLNQLILHQQILNFLHRNENVNYTDGIMHIRGKSYDPQPYGVYTDLHVWIKNSNETIIFDHTVEDLAMYYEGEWVTGEEILKGGPGALYYMQDFEKNAGPSPPVLRVSCSG